MRKSKVSWENSFFGGIKRVIYDYPSIHLPNNIVIKYNSSNRFFLSFLDKKMFDIFMLKTKDEHLIKKLLDEFYISKEISLVGVEENRLYISPASIKDCLDCLSYDVDLGNIFSNEEVVELLTESCDVYIIIPPNESAKDYAKSIIENVKELKYDWWKSRESLTGSLKDNAVFVKMISEKTTTYTSEQKRDGDSLVRMLDINYDPKSDKIENLKCGKMSSHKIAEIPAGNSHIYHRVEENQSTKPFSVCILCDESGSMQCQSLDVHQNNLVKTLYYAFSQMLPSERIYVFGHSGNSNPLIRIYQDRINQNFETSINTQLDNEYGQNYDGPVIECIYERVRQQAPDDNILFISISDGEPCGFDYGGDDAIKDLRRIIEKCKRDRFLTVGIGLNYNVDKIYNYSTAVFDNEDIVKKVSSIINIAVKTEFQN